MDTPRVGSRRRRRLLWTGAILGGAFVLYTALGFLAAPPILRRVLVRKASEALHRDVSVERVRVNPLTLSVTIAGLAVRNKDGSPFVSWDSLYVRAAPLRLVKKDVGLAEIRLVNPSVHAGLLADGSLSFQDLLTPSGAEAAPPAAPEQEGSGLGLAIGRLAVEDARVTFHDATRRPAFEGVVGPFTIRLESFRTRGGGESPYSFAGTTDAGESFRWSGTVSTQPLRSAGSLSFDRVALPRYHAYERAAAPLAVSSGHLDVGVRYEVEWGPARHVLRLLGGSATLTDLAVAPAGVDDPPVRLTRLAINGIEVDAVAHTAAVAEVELKGAAVRVRREADGSLELARMVPPSRPAAPAAAPSPWKWSVGAIAISGAALTWEDRVPPTPVTLPLTGVELKVGGLRPGADASSPVSLSLGWPSGGKVGVTGQVRPFAPQLELEVQATELDLVPLASYLKPPLAAQLSGGRAGARASVSYDGSAPDPRWSFAGDLRLDGLALAEQGNPALFRWRALEVNGVDAGSTPPHATVQKVRLLDPRAKIYVWEDGTTSFTRARTAPGAAEAPPRVASGKAAPATEWKTAIGAVEVSGGKATFLDRTVKPPAVIELTRAAAKVTRLSSDPRVRSSVEVLLEIAGASPIRVSGTLNPLQSSAYTDLAVSSQGVDLTPLDPYAGKYLGYALQKGKLELELRYKVEKRALSSTNVVRVDQLTLGDETHSPEAVHLPVRLALALLQDRDGNILLDVPVEGNLDDPQFRLGKVIWHTILNLLVKVATSPFSALAALAGGGHHELSMVEYTPGTAAFAPGSAERLVTLAKSLAQRPALGLEVEGTADEAADGEALRRAAVEGALRHAKALTLKPPPASEDDLEVAPEERPALLRAAFAAAFPSEAGGVASGAAGKKAARKEPEKEQPGTSPEELEARLLAAASVSPDAFTALAGERAQHARDALVEAGVDQGRLFLTQGGQRAAKEKGSRVYFEVK